MNERLDDSIFGEPEPRYRSEPAAQPAPATRSARHSQGRRRRHAPAPRRRRGAGLAAVLVALLVLSGMGYGAYRLVAPALESLVAQDDYSGAGSGQVQVLVAPGDSGAVIASSLVDAGVIKTTSAFIKASSANPALAGSIQPGQYTLAEQMSAENALRALTDPANRYVGPQVTIREGLWVSEILPLLAQATGEPLADYEAAVADPASIGLPEDAGDNVEGYLFPSTYTFPEGTTAAEQLSQMVALAVTELERAEVAPESWERTMIVASIIEGEVSGDADRSKVARVIENRLATTGAPSYGLLQMDSTVHYAEQRRGSAGTTDAERASDKAYNTYTQPGLPPGPINNPGAASIEAAANPDEGDWFFFVTVNPSTGETRFADTLQEHNKNVALFQQWCSDNPGQC